MVLMKLTTVKLKWSNVLLVFSIMLEHRVEV